MWTTEHSIDVAAEPSTVWGLWADVARWPEWNTPVAGAELDGPFAVGTTLTLDLHGADPIQLRICDISEPGRWADEATMDGVVVRVVHLAEPTAAGSRVTYRLEIEGPDVETVGPELGPAIAGDFPSALDALARAAGGR